MRSSRSTPLTVIVLGLAVAASLFLSHPLGRAALRATPPLAVLAFLLQPPSIRSSRRLPIALVLFVGWAIASTTWAADAESSHRGAADLAAMAVVGWCCGSCSDLGELHRLIARVARVIAVACVVALVIAPGPSTTPAIDGAPGWHAVFSHKNGMAAFAVLALVTWWFQPSPRRSWWLALGAVLVVGSRSSTALAIVLVLVAVLLWRRSLAALQRPVSKVGYLSLSLLLVVAGVTVFASQFDLATSLLGRGSTLSGRTDIWASAWRAWERRPLVGYGVGGVWESDVEPTSTIWKELRFEAFHAHSGYIDLLLQVGLVGAVLFAAMLAATAVGAAARRGAAAAWAATVLLVLVLNAAAETGPFLGSGFLLLAVLSSSTAQAPVPAGARTSEHGPRDGRTPRAARLASSSS